MGAKVYLGRGEEAGESREEISPDEQVARIAARDSNPNPTRNSSVAKLNLADDSEAMAVLYFVA